MMTVDPQGRVAIPRTIELLKDDRPSVRRRAAPLLGKFAPRARSAEAALRTALGDRASEVRAAVADALWKATHKRTDVLSFVVPLLKDEDETCD